MFIVALLLITIAFYDSRIKFAEFHVLNLCHAAETSELIGLFFVCSGEGGGGSHQIFDKSVAFLSWKQNVSEHC